MVERPRIKASTASRKRRRLFRSPGPQPVASDALTALARAWMVTTIATMLLFAALAIAPIWDRAIFVQALAEGLRDPEQMPAVEGPLPVPRPPRTGISRQ